MKLLMSLIIISLFLLPAPARAGTDAKAFFEKKCVKCHSMKADQIEKKVSKSGKKSRGPDLSGAGLNHEEAWFPKWLSKEVEKDSLYKAGVKVKHKKSFKKEGDETLNALAKWLSGHKTKMDVPLEEEGEDEAEGDEE